MEQNVQGSVSCSCLSCPQSKGYSGFRHIRKDVQDLSDTSIPEDVQGKLLQFAKSGLVVATLKGKSYLSMGSVSMGIVGSTINPEFFQDYLE